MILNELPIGTKFWFFHRFEGKDVLMLKINSFSGKYPDGQPNCEWAEPPYQFEKCWVSKYAVVRPFRDKEPKQ